MNSKTFFLEKIIVESGLDRPRVLEMGCGTARYVRPVLEKYPGITYVGLEPNKRSLKTAEQHIGEMEQVTLHNQLGYGELPDATPGSFDIVYSISALEHIKNLSAFIEMSCTYLKKGGLLVHRYDLGHALYPASLKERFQVFLGNRYPQVLPEQKFVRYLGESEVVAEFEKVGCRPYRRTYHQMPNHKALARFAEQTPELEKALGLLYRWEWENTAAFSAIPEREREQLFPTIAVWGRREA